MTTWFFVGLCVLIALFYAVRAIYAFFKADCFDADDEEALQLEMSFWLNTASAAVLLVFAILIWVISPSGCSFSLCYSDLGD